MQSKMLSQPRFQLRELGRAWLYQRPRGEPAHPVVGHTHRCSYLPVMADSLFYRFSDGFYTLFDVQGVDTIVATVPL